MTGHTEVCALAIVMCAGQLRKPNIYASTILYPRSRCYALFARLGHSDPGH